MIPLSVLDLVPVREGSGVGEALREAGELGPITYGIGLSRKTVSEDEFSAFERALDEAIADGTVPAILRQHQMEPAY